MRFFSKRLGSDVFEATAASVEELLHTRMMTPPPSNSMLSKYVRFYLHEATRKGARFLLAHPKGGLGNRHVQAVVSPATV